MHVLTGSSCILLSIACLPSLTGCGPPTVKDLPSAVLSLSNWLGQPDVATIQLDYDARGGCHEFAEGSQTAEINGRLAAVEELGHWNFVCRGSVFTAPLTAAERAGDPVSVKVTDGRSEVAATFLSPFAPVGLRVVTPSNGTLVKGQQAVLEWLPATHRYECFDNPNPVKVRFSGASGSGHVDVGGAVSGNRVTVTVPELSSATANIGIVSDCESISFFAEASACTPGIKCRSYVADDPEAAGVPVQ